MCKLGQHDSPVRGLVRLDAGSAHSHGEGSMHSRAADGHSGVQLLSVATQGCPLRWDSIQMSKYT